MPTPGSRDLPSFAFGVRWRYLKTGRSKIPMSHTFSLIRRLAGEDGQTTAEYGVLLAVISIVVLATMVILSGAVMATFQTVTNMLSP
jgi:Flp pilus assembly pilin Flp